MSLVDQLKSLSEEISWRHLKSIRSIEKLALDTDVVSAEIANLINDVQLIGNQQFVENRIHEDDCLTSIDNDNSDPPSFLQSRHNESNQAGDLQDENMDLKLATIILRAIELLPPTNCESSSDLNYSESQSGHESEPESSAGHQRAEAATEASADSTNLNQPSSGPSAIGDSAKSSVEPMDLPTPPRPPTPPPLPPPTQTTIIAPKHEVLPQRTIDATSIAAAAAAIVSKRKVSGPAGSKQSERGPATVSAEEQGQQAESELKHRDTQSSLIERETVGPKSSNPIKRTPSALDRARVNDILRKYSLYDDDDDEEEEED